MAVRWLLRFSEEKRSVTSAIEDAVNGDDISRRGSVERKSPQPDVPDAANVASLDQHESSPAAESTDPRSADTGSDLEMQASSPEPEDGRRLAEEGSRPAVETSPPPLPSPPAVTAAGADEDYDVTASLVITDVAKYVSKQDLHAMTKRRWFLVTISTLSK